MGPQHFSCQELTCSGLAYDFTDYGRLEITFSDGETRQSNIFTIKSFNSSYDVSIQENELTVTARTNPATLVLLLVGLCCCAGVLLGIAAIVRLITRRKAAA
ncbi:MAG: hypothetical protein KDD73_07775 [Anaerolineales bacterium]|nr:hypothetical protein [Anaerolineales bacterium]MCB9128686.1 hypothetical protein [Ardenticatenales bacterium]